MPCQSLETASTGSQHPEHVPRGRWWKGGGCPPPNRQPARRILSSMTGIVRRTPAPVATLRRAQLAVSPRWHAGISSDGVGAANLSTTVRTRIIAVAANHLVVEHDRRATTSTKLACPVGLHRDWTTSHANLPPSTKRASNALEPPERATRASISEEDSPKSIHAFSVHGTCCSTLFFEGPGFIRGTNRYPFSAGSTSEAAITKL